jgi:DHA2 family multidrug resistance protein
MKRFDVRLIIVAGFALFAASNFMNVEMTGDYATDQLFWPNVVRALGQALVLTPLSAIVTAGIEKENAGTASALFNMMRNLGGAMGIAALQTFQSKREQYHSNVISQSVSVFSEAIVAVGGRVRQQANIMAFSDTFYFLGVAMVVALIATLLLKKADHLDASGAH